MSLAAGTRLGPYEIHDLIGAGGMGEVYTARDPRLGRDVAVKVLRGDYSADPDRLRRFEQEARAAAALDHPNVVVVHDVGAENGQPFVVSELLEGETLREKIARGPIPVRKVIDYAAQIAHGLAAGHAKGIIHRDIKPANLFVTHGGRLKILDFGLAKLVATAGVTAAQSSAPTTTVTTRIGQIIGTAAYMSPEQIRGEELDHRSDIFSFGCVLYEMLAGVRPFERPTSFETMAATLNEEPPPLEKAADLPPALVQTLRRCLEKSPDDRFQSARDLAFELSLIGGDVPSGVNVRAFAGLRSVNLRRWLAIGAAAVLVVVAAFALGVRAGRTAPPTFRQLTFRRGDILSARFTPDGHTIVYGAAWDGKPVQLSSTRIEGTESRAMGLPDGDVLAISSTGEMAVSLGRRYTASHVARGTLARLPLDGASPRAVLADVEQADWSPDGQSLAVVRFAGGRYRLEFPVGTVLYETAGWISDARVSRDGSRVAFADHPVYGDDRGSICVVARSGGARQILSDGWASVTGLAWSTTGDEVWFTAADVGSATSLRAVTLSGRTRMILPAPSRLAVQDIDASGRVLLTSSKYRARIGSIDTTGGREHDWSWLDGSIATDLSPDGSTLLFSEQNTGSGTSAYAVYLRRTDGTPATRLGEGSEASLSPDGAWAAAVALGPPGRVVLLPTSVGEARTLVRGTLGDYQAVTWFPDGRRVLISAAEPGRRTRLWEQTVSDGLLKPLSIEGLRTAVSSRPISPDGRYAIALDEGDRVWLQPLKGGAAERLDGLERGDTPIRWDSDGTSFYVFRTGELPGTVYRYRLKERVKEPVVALAPADPAGVSGLMTVHATPDGRILFYTYSQALSDLYLVTNLR